MNLGLDGKIPRNTLSKFFLHDTYEVVNISIECAFSSVQHSLIYTSLLYCRYLKLSIAIGTHHQIASLSFRVSVTKT